MKVPFFNLVVPYEPYVIWEKAFTPEECQKIRDTGELLEFQKGRVGNNPTEDAPPEIRDSNLTWFQINHDTEWFYFRIMELASKINFDKFQLDLELFDGFQYSKYEEGGHYTWHIDTSMQYGKFLKPMMRKLSIAVMLSDREEYEGGEFEINPSGGEGGLDSFRPRQGDLVAFYSHVPHRVAPVTKGTRATLVTWILGEKLK